MLCRAALLLAAAGAVALGATATSTAQDAPPGTLVVMDERVRSTLAVDAATGARRTIAGSSDVAVSPDGQRLALLRTSPNWHLHVRAAGRERRVARGFANELAWSADGRRLAFVRSIYDRDVGSEVTSVWTVDARGGGLRRMSTADDESAPAFSASGRWLAWTWWSDEVDEDGDAGDRGLRVARARGGAVRELRDVAAPVAWSPRADRMAFERRATICAATPARLSRPACLPGRSGDSEPAWSPDGATIAFIRDGDLCTTAATLAAAVACRETPAPEATPRFSPDGRWIAVVRRAQGGGPDAVVAVPASGGAAERTVARFSETPELVAWLPRIASLRPPR